MNRILIYGGSFNPPCQNHIEVVRTIKRVYPDDELVIMPQFVDSLGKELISFEHRFQMCLLAFTKYPNYIISNWEYIIKNNTGSYNLYKQLKKEFENINQPEKKIVFIIGSDIVPNLHKWKNYKKLVKEMSFIVIGRTDYSILVESPINAEWLPPTNSKCSSTLVRQLIKEGKWNVIKKERYLNPQVIKYIKENKIYI